MTIVKKVGLGFGILVALAAIGSGVIYVWLSSNMVEVPELGDVTHVDSEIYDDAYLPAIEEAQAGLVSAREILVTPALSLAVSINGSLVWAEAQGYTNLTTLEPVNLKSRFAIGSVSKTMTATAAALLWESGRLDLDQDIHAYLPTYPELPYQLTMRQLLSHQGGIRHYGFKLTPPTFDESGLNVQFDTTAEALRLFSSDPLLFEPDTDFSYSTFGYTLASAVIEQAGDDDFLTVMQDLIIEPLGMTDTSGDFDHKPVSNRVSDYVRLFDNGEVLPAPATNSSYKWAGGGIASTPIDLVRFGGALVRGDFLAQSTFETMMTPRTLTNGEVNPQHYGLGWRIGGMSYPRGSDTIVEMFNHGGTAIGGVAILAIYPESGLVIAMVANSMGRGGSGAITAEAVAIANIFLDFIMAEESNLPPA